MNCSVFYLTDVNIGFSCVGVCVCVQGLIWSRWQICRNVRFTVETSYLFFVLAFVLDTHIHDCVIWKLSLWPRSLCSDNALRLGCVRLVAVSEENVPIECSYRWQLAAERCLWAVGWRAESLLLGRLLFLLYGEICELPNQWRRVGCDTIRMMNLSPV